MGAEATLKMLLLGEDRSAGRALKGVGNDADRTKGKLSGMAKVAGVTVAAAFVVLGRAAINAGKAAAEDAAAQAKLANTLRNAAGASKAQVAATEDWITAQGKALGVADDDLRPALARMVAVTKDVGQAQKDVALAMDVAAGSGKSLESVTTALAKARNGSLGGLARLGVATKDADGKTRSLDEITKELANTYRGAASTAAETTAGKQKRATLAFSEFREELGSNLLPIMGKVATAGIAMLAWVEGNSETVAILAGVLGGLAAAVWLVNTAAKAFKATAMALNIVMSANPVGLIILGLVALGVALVIAYKKSETFRTIVNAAFQAIKTVIATVVMPYLRLLGVAWLTMAIVAIGALKLLLSAAFAVFSGILSAADKGMGWIPGIGDKIKGAKRAFDDFGNKTIGTLDKMQGALIGTRDKVSQLGKAKARPTIDTSSIDRANTRLDKLIAKLNTASAGLLGPVLTFGNGGRTAGHNAVGTGFHAGGATWVGERGPELVNIPRGSRVHTAAESAAMAAATGGDLGTITVIVQSDSGEVIEKKLAKVKRTSGRPRLEFEAVS